MQTGVLPGHCTPLIHSPLESQVCGALPLHWVRPGVQARHAPFQHAGVAPAHVVWSCHAPHMLQSCTMLAAH